MRGETYKVEMQGKKNVSDIEINKCKKITQVGREGKKENARRLIPLA